MKQGGIVCRKAIPFLFLITLSLIRGCCNSVKGGFLGNNSLDRLRTPSVISALV